MDFLIALLVVAFFVNKGIKNRNGLNALLIENYWDQIQQEVEKEFPREEIEKAVEELGVNQKDQPDWKERKLKMIECFYSMKRNQHVTKLLQNNPLLK